MSKIVKNIFSLLFSTSLCLSGCAGMDTTPRGQDRGGSLDQQVKQHDAAIKQMQPAQAEMWNQLQALRQELNGIKGQLDDINNLGGARALIDRLARHDQALRQIEGTAVGSLNLGEPMVNPIGNPSYAQAGQMDTATPSTNNEANGHEIEGLAQNRPNMAVALYDAGLNAFNSRRYAEAQRSFSDFIKNYSNHELIAEAQFYLAECYFQNNQFGDAALAYDTVISKYATSNRAPAAYLKQGISFSKMNHKAAARDRMNELIKKYPTSQEATQAKAFLKTNR